MHLRIGVAALLLAAPALAQDTPPPGWIKDARTGCKVWDHFPVTQEEVSWSGPCAGGVAEGTGVLEWRSDGEPVGRYQGQLRGGKADGRGTYHAANGNRYDGQWREGKRSGQGMQSYPDGSSYLGNFRDGEYDGQGVLYVPGLGRYDGQWKAGRPHGQLTLRFESDGETYSGTWTNGCFRQGRRTWSFGATKKDCGFE